MPLATNLATVSGVVREWKLLWKHVYKKVGFVTAGSFPVPNHSQAAQSSSSGPPSHSQIGIFSHQRTQTLNESRICRGAADWSVARGKYSV